MTRSLLKTVTAGVALLLIAAGVVLLGPGRIGPSASGAAGFTVNGTADASDASPGDGFCDDGSGNCTLRAAIQEANALAGGDFITVPAGTYNLSAGQLSITIGLTLSGAGASTTIVDGGGLDRVFTTTGTVEISGLTIRNGFSATDYEAGGIYNGGRLTLNDSTVSGNTATGEYSTGGIYNGNTLTLNNSTVSGNSSTGYSGNGGIKNPSSRTLTLNSSTVSGNSTTTGYGAAGISNFQWANATLNHSTVSGNSGDGEYGTGGIKSYQSATLTLNNSTVSGNSSAGNYGVGGIETFQSAVSTLNNSTVSGNSSAGHYGTGGIQTFQSAILTLNNSTVTGNSAFGAKATGGIEHYQSATATLKNTIVANNGGDDCNGPVISAGYNLDSDGSCGLSGTGDISNVNTLLGPLADNGGPTFTHALLAGSPAIDAGSGDCPPPTTDQRGEPRTTGPCDIGAVECPAFGCPPPTPIPTPTPCDGPCPTATATATATATPTPTATPTVTPTKQPFPGDTDGDGCTDQQENGLDEFLGGRRDFLNPWDYFNPSGDGFNRMDDILGVIEHYSPTGAPPYDVNYDTGADIGKYYWNRTAPDGKIDLPNDILGIILTYHHDCSTPPLPGPTPPASDGLGFSIGVDTGGSAADDCDTKGGATTCTLLDYTFTLNIYLDSVPNGVSGYVALNTAVTFNGVKSPVPAGLNDWVDCSVAAFGYAGASEVAMGCTTDLLPPLPSSTYTGLIGSIDFTCTADGQISLAHSEIDTALFEDAATFHIEGSGSTETLTINCDDLTDTDGDGCSDQRESSSNETLGGQRDDTNPWDFYDVSGPGSAFPKDKRIDLPNDILGVILSYTGNDGYTPGDSATSPYPGTMDNYDRGPATVAAGGGPNPWNMTASDGIIDLPNDILGVILQYGHDCG